MKRLIVVFLTCGLIVSALSPASAATISFTAGDIKNVLHSYLAELDITNYYYGITGIRVNPIITGDTSSFTFISASTTQTGWEAVAPGPLSSPYAPGQVVEFRDAGNVINYSDGKLYMITSKPAGDFKPFPLSTTENLTIYKVDDASSFTFSFTTSGTWNGAYQFLVDGQKFDAHVLPATWDSSFYGAWVNHSELPGNEFFGYQVVPIPSPVLLFGSGLLGLVGWRRFRKG